MLPRVEYQGHCRRVASLASNVANILNQPALAFEIVSACNEFDDAVEGAALERTPLSDAIADYLDSAEAFHPAGVIAALRITRPRAKPGKLPVLPSAMSKILQCQEECTDAAWLSHIAATDQVLAARLLGAANSAYYGARQEITRLLDAVLRLGVPIARKVLLEACVGGLFASAPLRNLWTHARLVAAAAAEIAAPAGVDVDLAFTAGLLHDIGRLEQISDTPENQRVLDDWLDGGLPLAYAETLIYGSDHASSSTEMLRGWNLPVGITDAIAMHHTPEFAESSALAAVLFIAEVWCERRTGSQPEALNTALRVEIAQQKAGLTAGMLDRLDGQSLLFDLAKAA